MRVQTIVDPTPLSEQIKLPDNYQSVVSLKEGVVTNQNILEELTKMFVIGSLDTLGWKIGDSPNEGEAGREAYVAKVERSVRNVMQNNGKLHGLLLMSVGDEQRVVLLSEDPEISLLLAISTPNVKLGSVLVGVMAVQVVGPVVRVTIN